MSEAISTFDFASGVRLFDILLRSHGSGQYKALLVARKACAYLKYSALMKPIRSCIQVVYELSCLDVLSSADERVLA